MDSVKKRLSEAEFVRLAEQFTDMVFDPKRPWVRNSFLAGLEQEMRKPGLLDTINKKAHVEGLLPRVPHDRTQIVRLRDAVMRHKRKETLAFLIAEFQRDPPTHQLAQALLNIGDPHVVRKAFLGAADQFKGKPGPTPRIAPTEYFELADNADRLRPALEKFLNIQQVTKHSTNQILDFLEEEGVHPEACAFLQRHVQELNSALESRDLLKRGMRTASRAGVLADALAGADKKFSFRTSMEYVRQGRHQRSEEESK
jgi:hypothetical protein